MTIGHSPPSAPEQADTRHVWYAHADNSVVIQVCRQHKTFLLPLQVIVYVLCTDLAAKYTNLLQTCYVR